MSLSWIQESPPCWDEPKTRIIGGQPEGVFRKVDWKSDQLIPGDWWRVESDGKTIGYGWMECDWAEAEILLAVDPDSQGKGVGNFILDQLEKEASTRGLNYLYNVVRPEHPHKEGLTRWLQSRRFSQSKDSDRLMRRVEYKH